MDYHCFLFFYCPNKQASFRFRYYIFEFRVQTESHSGIGKLSVARHNALFTRNERGFGHRMLQHHITTNKYTERA